MSTDIAPMRFYAETYIDAAPDIVWSFFEDVGRWPHWSPVCGSCSLIGATRLSLGAVLDTRLSIVGLTLSIRSSIVQLEPPNLITWSGSAFGLTGRHTYRFQPRGRGTYATNEEILYGVAFPLSILVRRWFHSTGLSSASLEGLKREVERSHSGQWL